MTIVCCLSRWFSVYVLWHRRDDARFYELYHAGCSGRDLQTGQRTGPGHFLQQNVHARSRQPGDGSQQDEKGHGGPEHTAERRRAVQHHHAQPGRRWATADIPQERLNAPASWAHTPLLFLPTDRIVTITNRPPTPAPAYLRVNSGDHYALSDCSQKVVVKDSGLNLQAVTLKGGNNERRGKRIRSKNGDAV